MAVALASRFWSVHIWVQLLRRFGTDPLPPFAVMSGVFSKAWMGRYLPGKVAWVAGKVYFAAAHGIDKQRLAVTSVLESLLQILVFLDASLLVLLLTGQLRVLDTRLQSLSIAVAVVLSLLLIPSVFNAFIALTLRVMRRPESGSNQLTGSVLAGAVGRYLVGAALSGGSYYLLAATLVDVALSDALFVMASFTLAGTIGILSFFAPSGIGVREGVAGLLLATIMSNEDTIAIVIAARLFSTVADLAFLGLGQAWAKITLATASREIAP